MHMALLFMALERATDENGFGASGLSMECPSDGPTNGKA